MFLESGDQTTIILQAGEKLTLAASATLVLGRVVPQTNPRSEPLAPIAYNGSAVTFGPYDDIAVFDMECAIGTIPYSQTYVAGDEESRALGRIKHSGVLSSSKRTTTQLPRGSILTIAANAGSIGSIYLLDVTGLPEPGTPIPYTGASIVIGPFSNTCNYRLICDLGVMSFVSSLDLTGGGGGGGLIPVNTVAPVIAGTAAQFGILAVTNIGTWSNAPTSYLYQWYLGNTALVGQSGSYDPTGDSLPSISLNASHVGSASVSCRIIGVNGSGSSATAPSNALGPVTADAALTDARVSRFMAQATVGVNETQMNAAKAAGVEPWITSQLAVARPTTFYARAVAQSGSLAAAQGGTGAEYQDRNFNQMFTTDADKLRIKVGRALASFLVASVKGISALGWRPFIIPAYMDIIWNDAFGNFRNILMGISQNPAMCAYLTFNGSRKFDNSTGAQPDENYAREFFQLFTLGLNKIRMNGVEYVDGFGKAIPTYIQPDIYQAARVFTGREVATDFNSTAWVNGPVAINETYRETGSKAFIGANLAAGRTASQDLNDTVDAAFNHPNIAPFVALRLIQQMVTSNPSPAYVNRVASAFVNNGSNVRGDMAAVVKAVLTDGEARNDAAALASTTFGKKVEPEVLFYRIMCAFNYASPNGSYILFGDYSDATDGFAQMFGRSPSVFYDFRPQYSPPNTTINSAGLVAPEFGITNEVTVVGFLNRASQINSIPTNGATPLDLTTSNGSSQDAVNFDPITTLTSDANLPAMLNWLNKMLCASQVTQAQMDAIRADLISGFDPGDNAGLRRRAMWGLWCMISLSTVMQ